MSESDEGIKDNQEGTKETRSDSDANASGERVFEMLWDCEYCGTNGLLGKSNKFCPGCGAKQNADKRYFPDEEKKVEVVNHTFEGADKVCGSCNNTFGAKAEFCPACGAPADGSRRANIVEDTSVEPVESKKAKEADQGSGKKKGLLIGGGIALVAAVFAFLSMYKTDITVTAKSHYWETSIAIEKHKKSTGEGACSSMPSGAYGVQRYPGKEKCTKERKDQGDGTFVEKNVCKKEEDRCSYSYDKWANDRTARNKGGLNDTVRMPIVHVTGGTCMGCTREGRRNTSYVVKLQGPEKLYSCSFSEPGSWREIKDGTTYGTGVNLLGSLDCKNMTVATK